MAVRLEGAVHVPCQVGVDVQHEQWRVAGISLITGGIGIMNVLLAMGLAVLVGGGFGLYPALGASRLSPIKAIRHD